MPVTLDPDHRAEGLVWLEPALANLPATHVLLVGVGRFADKGLAALTSPPASARAMADWFLNGAMGKPGFANPDRPLVSLSVLLSEETPSQVAGGAVPEATFSNVQRALRGWITRASANPASAAILFLASHGQADFRRTAVLFQDYGGDPLDPFAGMTEVEQLTRALTTLDPADKLLIFDTCRTPNPLSLSDDRSFGTPLIGGRVPPAGFMGVRPTVLRSTRLGAAAYGGGTQGTTLFTGALLDALSGLAAEPADDWRIYAAEVSTTAEEILRLWREDGEPLQVPAYESEGKVPISQISEPAKVPFFLALPPEQDITTARFALYRQDGTVPVVEANGPTDGRPFIRFDLDELVPYRVTAHDAAGGLIGEMVVKSRMPRLIKVMAPGTPPVDVQVTRTKSADAADGGALRVNVDAVAGLPQTPVIRAARVGGPPPPQSMPAPAPSPGIGRSTGFWLNRNRPPRVEIQTSGAEPLQQRRDLNRTVHAKPGDDLRLEPGKWVIRASRPGAADVETMVEVEDGDEVTLNLPGLGSGHEWLAPAVLAGVIAADQREDGPFDLPDPAISLLPAEVTSTRAHGNGRLALYRLADQSGERFAMRQNGPQNAPVWAEFHGNGWRERCFLPVQGAVAEFFFGHEGQDPWRVEVLVDDAPPRNRSHVAAFAISGQFGALLAFLAGRSFLNAGAALRQIAADIPLRDAVLGKLANPLAALAAAQIAVATGQAEDLGIPEDWLENLTTWFPTLPDGPVILGRYRQRRGQPAADLFAEGHRRGVPVFSLTLDWLSEGLDLSGHPAAGEIHGLALRADPSRVFTVLRLPPEAS